MFEFFEINGFPLLTPLAGWPIQIFMFSGQWLYGKGLLA
jgi:hypothetical protein